MTITKCIKWNWRQWDEDKMIIFLYSALPHITVNYYSEVKYKHTVYTLGWGLFLIIIDVNSHFK